MANEKTALVVIDMQKAVLEASAHSEKILANVVALVEKARAEGVPVVWVQHESEGIPRNTPGWQYVDELVPAPDEPLVPKTYADVFAETELKGVLEGLGAKHFYLCGAMTDACIRSTLFGGVYRGYDVTLVADAHTTADRDEFGYTADQAVAIVNMMANYTVLPDAHTDVTTTASFPVRSAV